MWGLGVKLLTWRRESWGGWRGGDWRKSRQKGLSSQEKVKAEQAACANIMAWPGFLLMALWVTKFSLLHYLVFYISTSADVTYNRNNEYCVQRGITLMAVVRPLKPRSRAKWGLAGV